MPTAPVNAIRSLSPWLSVVIPSYNGEAWIASALQSIAAQADEGIEVLLVDGGPTRATCEIADTYSTRLRLRIFERPDLTSWQTKTNFAVDAAESAHVCWLGVDDVWLPGRVRAIRNWIDEAPDAYLHLAPTAIIDRDGRSIGMWRCPFSSEGLLQSGFVVERLLVQNFIGAPSPVFRKEAWLACGGLDVTLWYTADWDIWLKLVAGGAVYYHADVTVGFRIHGGSLTVTGSRDIAAFEEQMKIVLNRHLQGRRLTSVAVERAARASIAVNTALAIASSGKPLALVRALSAIFGLGPSGIRRYLRDSRLADRVLPRLRAKLAGSI
jgi:glycosyltransferase involved in cell wall biosynthesis